MTVVTTVMRDGNLVITRYPLMVGNLVWYIDCSWLFVVGQYSGWWCGGGKYSAYLPTAFFETFGCLLSQLPCIPIGVGGGTIQYYG